MTSDAPAKSLFIDTNTLVASIHRDNVIPTPGQSILQKNLTTLTSYDLLPGEKGTIIVPGCPPIWSPPPLPADVPPDSGAYDSDPVRSIFPQFPLEPFFRALAITKPTFDLSTIDVISDRRNLRLLRSFMAAGDKKAGDNQEGDNNPFRIDVEVVGKTLLFSCWHSKDMDVLEEGEFRGYGREFEKVFTRRPKEVRGSVSHNRAITYDLGGLRLVVRFKVEGYIPGLKTGPGNRGGYKGLPYKTMKELNPKVTPTGYDIVIRGKFVPSAQLLEIKTGKIRNPAPPSQLVGTKTGKIRKPVTPSQSTGTKTRKIVKDPEERSVDQMWFSRTRILCAGRWENYRFTIVDEIDMLEKGKLDTWAAEQEKSLRGLVRVLEMIAEVVRGKEGRYALVREEGSSELKVMGINLDCQWGLPEDLKEGWGKGLD